MYLYFYSQEITIKPYTFLIMRFKYTSPLFIATIAVGCFTAGLSSAQFYQQFYDVPQNHFAANAIRFVQSKGLMRGRTPQYFAPNGAVSRAELAVVLERLYTTGVVNNNYNSSQYYNPYNPYNNNTYYSPYTNAQTLDERYNDERERDIERLAKAIKEYFDENEEFPDDIEEGEYKEICFTSAGVSCGRDLIDLDVLRPDYISSIPQDPSIERVSAGSNARNNTTGYFVKIDSNDRVYVIARLSSKILEEIR